MIDTTPMVAALVVAVLYLLHQDFWFWRDARPIVFGFLPIGLFYHAAYTLACSVLLWWLVRSSWPAHLEDGPGDPHVPRPSAPRRSHE